MLILHGVTHAANRRSLATEATAFAAGVAAIAPDARLRVLTVGRLAALVTEVAGAAAAAFQEALSHAATAERLTLAHAHVLNQLAARIDMAPARLSGAAETPEALLEALAAREAALLGQLRRVSGAAEYVLKITQAEAAQRSADPGAAPEAAFSSVARGRDYLKARLSRRRARDGRSRAVASLLAGAQSAAESFARDLRVVAGPTERRPNLLIDLAILAPRQAEARVAELADAVGARAAALGLVSEATGPWAPFSFVDPVAEDGASGPPWTAVSATDLASASRCAEGASA